MTDPVAPAQTTGVDIEEREAFAVSGYVALVGVLVGLGLATWLGLLGGGALGDTDVSVPLIVLAAVIAVVALVLLSGLTINKPGETRVVTFFGSYLGTVRRTGLSMTYPLTGKSYLPVRVLNFETERLKVNERGGSPVDVSAIVVWRVADTAKTVDADGRITGTADRDTLRIVQTPQAFAFGPLLAAHRKAEQAGRTDFTDDAALMEWAGHTVSTFEGETGNFKLTTAEDFMRAETMLHNRLSDVRTGMGFDVHAFGPGDHVTLGGLRIAHDRGLSGHSDADVVLHAIVDAILGALADGDIGAHFPPSDPQWKGATSDRFVKFAVERLAKRGGVIAHLDVTIVSEAPKIGPHRDAMRARIAEIAGIDPGRVGVKATTNEAMGFIGRREGMVAYATATIRLPAS